MRNDKEKIIALRKTGLSYSQISAKTGVSKSTLSTWLKHVKISKKAQDKINTRVHKRSILKLIERNKNQSALATARHEKARTKAKGEYESYARERLFVVGVALYWAEGYKMGASGSKWKSIDFANADPDMISLMMKFFRKYCLKDDRKFSLQIIAHENVDSTSAIDYWCSVTGLKAENFMKISTVKSRASKNRRPTRRLPYGTLHIRINDVALFFQLIGWIDGMKNRYKTKET